ncbi:hypothetical protein AB1Y20_012482 [Prymnesium parvum]|uniref:Calmodulin-lysine N-methyltransferase n=1 Tax=Prymnesium parvum TaxID=97485 RepID=A0AB34IKN9_PRYPA
MALLLHCLSLPEAVARTSLRPPTFVSRSGGVTALRVEVAPDLALTLHEADVTRQAALVDLALEAPSSSPSQDPYGVVLWPAAQVVASTLAATPLSGARVVELGAGTGLCALTAAARGASVLATDYRTEPLELLQASAQATSVELGRPLEVQTACFDVKSAACLPPGDILVAADLLYLQSTSEALARRCAEAVDTGYKMVLIGDCGRPGRSAFLSILRDHGYNECFVEIEGWALTGNRHELISSRGDPNSLTCKVCVGLLRLNSIPTK